MNTDELEQMKERIAGAYAESPGGDLDGMLVDIRQALDRTGIFADVTTHKTGSRAHLIEVRCRRTTPEITTQRAVSELLRAWSEDLRYDDFEGHTVEITETAIVLDFLTGSNAARLYVTGMVVVALT